MPFERGSFTFAMFDLNGELPDNLLDLFKARKAGPLDSVSEEPQLGWVTGQHLLDTDIDENAMMGGSYYLTLRQAVRKMPTALLNAVCKREERAYMRANNLEYVSSKMKKQIRDEALEKHIQKMPPALSGIPMVLDPNDKLLYVGASSNTQIDLYLDMFFQTLKVEPIQLTPGLILEKKYQTTAVSFPELSFNGKKSSEPTIGRDFLTWLWYYSETESAIQVEPHGEFEVLVEAPLLFIADEGQGAGESTVKKGDSPTRSAEAKAALAAGKKLKKAKISITRGGEIWSGTFDADQFAFGSFKLPEGENMDEDSVFCERIQNLSVFRDAFIGYFCKFADSMMGIEAENFQKKVREWAENRDAL